jgi:hypothetical protein
MQSNQNSNDVSSLYTPSFQINEEQKLNILINDNTKHCVHSNNNTDKIQCALEYNYYLIKILTENQGQLTQECYADLMEKLENNLIYLAKNCDSFRKRFKLKTEIINKENTNNNNDIKPIRNENKEIIKPPLEDSISNNLRRSKRKEKEKEKEIKDQYNIPENSNDKNYVNSYTGITITIRKSDMSILN